MKRILAIFLLICLCLSFTSCDSVFSSVETLMRPPELSGKDKKLHETFLSSVSNFNDVIMKTPFEGEYRSSYIYFDIDGDKNDEAFVFYTTPSQNSSVIADIFKYRDNEWKKTSQIKENGDIYEVNFADVNGDGCFEILLSYMNLSERGGQDISNRTLMIYSYKNNKTELITTNSYTNLFVEDLNNNHSDEIVLFKITLSDTGNRTTANIISFNNDFSINYDKTVNITSLINIQNIVSDRIVLKNKSITRIFVDGDKHESGLITEIIEIDEKSLNISLPLYYDNLTSEPNSFRNNDFYCFDIDKDGIIEIPTLEAFPYALRLSEDGEEPINLVVWSVFEKGEFRVKCKTLFNTQLGSAVFIPEDFYGNISVIYDEENYNLTFYSIDSDGEFSNAIFSIRVFTEPDWQENNYNYEMLYENGSFVYGYLIFKADNYEKYKDFIINNYFVL